MDIEKINAVLTKAIMLMQEAQIDAVLSSMSKKERPIPKAGWSKAVRKKKYESGTLIAGDKTKKVYMLFTPLKGEGVYDSQVYSHGSNRDGMITIKDDGTAEFFSAHTLDKLGKALVHKPIRGKIRESIEANRAEAKRAQAYARAVADEMLRMRGYGDSRKAPAEAVNDVHRVLVKADRIYTRFFASRVKPEKAAEMIQNLVWDGKLKVEQVSLSEATWTIYWEPGGKARGEKVPSKKAGAKRAAEVSKTSGGYVIVMRNGIEELSFYRGKMVEQVSLSEAKKVPIEDIVRAIHDTSMDKHKKNYQPFVFSNDIAEYTGLSIGVVNGRLKAAEKQGFVASYVQKSRRTTRHPAGTTVKMKSWHITPKGRKLIGLKSVLDDD